MAKHRPLETRMAELQAQMASLQAQANKAQVDAHPEVQALDAEIDSLNKKALKWKRWQKDADMDWLIWIGAAISFLGIIGIVLSILRVRSARRADLTDEEMRAAVQKAIPLNMGALFTSVIGLMMVIVGISFS